MLLAEVREQSAANPLAVGWEATLDLGNWQWVRVDNAIATPPDAQAAPVDGVVGALPAALPFQIDVTLRADPLTAIMLAMVTFISSLVAIYASGYMHGDRGYWRFFTLHRRCSCSR